MPDTLYLFVALFELERSGGRAPAAAAGGDGGWALTCRFRAGSDCCPIDGGVREPLVGVVP